MNSVYYFEKKQQKICEICEICVKKLNQNVRQENKYVPKICLYKI